MEDRSIDRFSLPIVFPPEEALMAARLRAVGVDEKAPPKSVTDAAEHGSRRDLLVSMRARVAIAVQDPNTPARDLAALTRRLMEIAKDIEALDVKDAEDTSGDSTADEPWVAI